MESNEKTKAQGRQENLECKFKNPPTMSGSERGRLLKRIALGKKPTPQTESVKKLQEDFKKLLVGGKHSDVVLKVEGREFKAHRSILSARSDYFSTMFHYDTPEKETGVVTIKDCDPDAFQCLLHYIYTGETNNSPGSIANLYVLADRYQVQELKEECVKQIKGTLAVENFCEFANMSLRHHELNLKEIISHFFTDNALDIISTSEWTAFMEQNPRVCNEWFYKTLKTKTIL